MSVLNENASAKCVLTSVVFNCRHSEFVCFNVNVVLVCENAISTHFHAVQELPSIDCLVPMVKYDSRCAARLRTKYRGCRTETSSTNWTTRGGHIPVFGNICVLGFSALIVSWPVNNIRRLGVNSCFRINILPGSLTGAKLICLSSPIWWDYLTSLFTTYLLKRIILLSSSDELHSFIVS